ncbi:MAG: bifunctional folylpolyglutamate synthase/dihydrofolate synthase, partial [Acetobacteraceae bacterium]
SCAITSISLDHRDLLGDTLGAIAAEKAGIVKPGVPVAIGAQEPEAKAVLLATAARVGAPVRLRGRDWDIMEDGDGLRFTDPPGTLHLPRPSLLGPHQHDNAGIAISALRATPFGFSAPAYALGVASAVWPARLQRLGGRLAALLPDGWELWLDGGHNPGAGAALAAQLDIWRDRPTHLVIGMKQSKDTAAFLLPLIPRAASVWAVAEPDQHLALPVAAIVAASKGAARIGPRVEDALRGIGREAGSSGRVLICGSLYLAGEVLKLDADDARQSRIPAAAH